MALTKIGASKPDEDFPACRGRLPMEALLFLLRQPSLKSFIYISPDSYLGQGKFLLKLTSLGLMTLNGQIKEEAIKMASKRWADCKISQSDKLSDFCQTICKYFCQTLAKTIF
jgi:hypothetical protein